MSNSNRERGVDTPVYMTRLMMLIAYLGLLLLLCGSSGCASLYKGNTGRACLQGDRSQDSSLQLDELSTEGLGMLENSGRTSSVFRTDGEPLLNKRFLRGTPKRGGRSNSDEEFINADTNLPVGYDGRDGDILKSLILHLIKYPRRLNRAESKSENYNLRANYIPRLGKKRSYVEQK